MTQPQDPDADVPSGSVRVHASLPKAEGRSRLATAVSFVLHLLIIYLALRFTANAVMPEHSPIGDAIQMVLGGGGGGGGQGGQAFNHATAPPPPPTVTPPVVQPPPPPPVPTVIPPPPAAEPPPAPAIAPVQAAASGAASAGTGTGTGGGNGTGTGTGNGSGEGPGTGSGKGGGTGGGTGGFPPESRQIILPPLEGTPKELRGKPVDVTFFVTAAGMVSDVKVSPPIENKSFAKKFDEVMRGYTFKPARDAAGNKIAGSMTMQITFGPK